MAARVCSFHSRAAEGAAEAGKGLRERRARVPRGRRRREFMARGAGGAEIGSRIAFRGWGNHEKREGDLGGVWEGLGWGVAGDSRN